MTTIFSDNWTGTNGSSWDSNKWTTSTNGGTSVVDIQSNEGHLKHADSFGAYARAVASHSSQADQELLVKTRFGATGARGIFTVTLRGSGTWSGTNPDVEPNTGYYVYRRTDGGTATLYKQVSGTRTSLGTFTWTNDTNNWWLRFRVEGTTVSVRIWQDGNTEPSTWDLQVTDSDIASGVTQIGFGRASGTFDAYVDDLTLDDLVSGTSVAVSAVPADGTPDLMPVSVSTIRNIVVSGLPADLPADSPAPSPATSTTVVAQVGDAYTDAVSPSVIFPPSYPLNVVALQLSHGDPVSLRGPTGFGAGFIWVRVTAVTASVAAPPADIAADYAPASLSTESKLDIPPADMTAGAAPPSVGAGVGVSAPAADQAADTPIHAVAAGTGTSLQPDVADTAADLPPVTVDASVNVTVAAPTGDTVTDGIPAVVAAGATVAAPASDVTADSVPVSVSAGNVTLSPVADTAADLPPGAVSLSGNVTVTVPSGDVVADGAAAVVAAGATVAAPAGDTTGDGLPAAVAVGKDVAAPPADTVGDAPASSVAAVRNVSVSPPAADGTSDAAPPTVTAGVSTVAQSPVADAMSDGSPPLLSLAASISAPSADAGSDIPAVSMSVSIVIDVPVGDLAVDAEPPAVALGIDLSVPAADASGDAPPSTVSTPDATVLASIADQFADVAAPLVATNTISVVVSGTPGDSLPDVAPAGTRWKATATVTGAGTVDATASVTEAQLVPLGLVLFGAYAPATFTTDKTFLRQKKRLIARKDE